jgi:hypothetical protein
LGPEEKEEELIFELHEAQNHFLMFGSPLGFARLTYTEVEIELASQYLKLMHRTTFKLFVLDILPLLLSPSSRNTGTLSPNVISLKVSRNTI